MGASTQKTPVELYLKETMEGNAHKTTDLKRSLSAARDQYRAQLKPQRQSSELTFPPTTMKVPPSPLIKPTLFVLSSPPPR